MDLVRDAPLPGQAAVAELTQERAARPREVEEEEMLGYEHRASSLDSPWAPEGARRLPGTASGSSFLALLGQGCSWYPRLPFGFPFGHPIRGEGRRGVVARVNTWNSDSKGIE